MLLLQNILQNYVSIWHWRPSPSITLCKAMVGCKQTIPSLWKMGHGHADWTRRHRINDIARTPDFLTVYQLSYCDIIGGLILFFVDTLKLTAAAEGLDWQHTKDKFWRKCFLVHPFFWAETLPCVHVWGKKGQETNLGEEVGQKDAIVRFGNRQSIVPLVPQKIDDRYFAE